jgi:hypothetical protein
MNAEFENLVVYAQYPRCLFILKTLKLVEKVC